MPAPLLRPPSVADLYGFPFISDSRSLYSLPRNWSRLREAEEKLKDAIEELQIHYARRGGGRGDRSVGEHQAIGNLCQSFMISYGVRVGIGILLRAFKLARRRSYSSILDLKRMMAMYVASHYKNSPNDLQLMADAPSHHLFVLLGPVDESKNHLPDILCVIQRQPERKRKIAETLQVQQDSSLQNRKADSSIQHADSCSSVQQKRVSCRRGLIPSIARVLD
ncbi:UPF0202 protein [Platanthera guangdongensis]|uniref:UPF0202 protein n=1 Tax=Platanthera guangdongensis TaxID=2320717 RepID=A0ABR2MGU3_9ASPA